MLTMNLRKELLSKKIKGNKSECECLGVYMLHCPSHHCHLQLCRIPVLKISPGSQKENALENTQ